MPPRHQGAGGRVTGGTSVISRQQLIGLVGITLMWGINWPMMKYSLREMTPLYFRAATMSTGALWLFIFYRARGLRMVPVRLTSAGDHRVAMAMAVAVAVMPPMAPAMVPARTARAVSDLGDHGLRLRWEGQRKGNSGENGGEMCFHDNPWQ